MSSMLIQIRIFNVFSSPGWVPLQITRSSRSLRLKCPFFLGEPLPLPGASATPATTHELSFDWRDRWRKRRVLPSGHGHESKPKHGDMPTTIGIFLGYWGWVKTYNTIFFEGWTSMNPSYFDVIYRVLGFWAIAIYMEMRGFPGQLAFLIGFT
jgi:hypothetical protein